jgi:hypothetical protein
MMKTATLFTGLLLRCIFLPAQALESKHNPKVDLNLSPTHNASICPEHNASINPQANWNINPQKNGLICPDKVDAINPGKNMDLNPVANTAMNPMFAVSMSPKDTRWKGLYLFDKEDELAGYITKYSQELMLEFDRNADWKYF